MTHTSTEQPAPQVQADARDAARYRWLRARDLETIGQGGVFAGMTPQNVILNGQDLDDAIDAALAAKAKQEEQS